MRLRRRASGSTLPRVPCSRRVIWLSSLPAMLAFGCGASPGAYGTPAAAGASADWATRILGGPPTRILVERHATRPDLAARVPWHEALALDVGLGSPGTTALADCEQADAYTGPTVPGVESPRVIVLHAVPPGLDPTRPDEPDGGGPYAPRFALQAQTAAGVRAYACTGPCAYEGRTQDLRLFVLPSSTWIFATGQARARLAAALDGDAREPSRAPSMPGSIADEWESHVPALLDHDVMGVGRAIAVGEVLFPPAFDGSVSIGMKVLFPSADLAQAAARDLTNLLARHATEVVCREGEWGLEESQAYRDAHGVVTQWQSAPTCRVSSVGPVLLVTRPSVLAVLGATPPPAQAPAPSLASMSLDALRDPRLARSSRQPTKMPGSREPPEEVEYLEALDAEHAGDLRAARSKYADVAARFPESLFTSLADFGVGETFLHSVSPSPADLSAALDAYQRALARPLPSNPIQGWAWLRVGQIREREGQMGPARRAYASAMQAATMYSQLPGMATLAAAVPTWARQAAPGP